MLPDTSDPASPRARTSSAPYRDPSTGDRRSRSYLPQSPNPSDPSGSFQSPRDTFCAPSKYRPAFQAIAPWLDRRAPSGRSRETRSRFEAQDFEKSGPLRKREQDRKPSGASYLDLLYITYRYLGSP